ncbi:MAG: N-acetyl sugar amidotransferase [Sandaracinaceae bacterium]|nr:N-acetyl sugar amidotransferase [Sandaracinaceae bacterium]
MSLPTNKNGHEVRYGLPGEVRFCSRCVISNQRPNSTVEFKNSPGDSKAAIQLDDDLVCSACAYHATKEVGIDWEAREELLWKMLERYRRTDGGYDVIIPGSGGKDSAYTAHILKYKYKMNPLTVTWAPHLYTDIGWRNFTNWMHVGGLDNMLYTPNGRLHRLLTKMAVFNLMHPFQPFIIGQRIIGPAMAARFGVKLVMYGENQAEYGNSVDENNIPTMDYKFFARQDDAEPILGGEPISKILSAHPDLSLGDFAPYIPMSEASLREKNVDVHYLGYYLKWDPQECFYYAAEHTGFEPNTERTEGSYSKYSSIDDKVDPFHYYTTLLKFGIGRATYDAAQEVRNGKITREEAVALAERFDTEFPERFYPDFLEYLGTTDDELRAAFDDFRSPHLWGKDASGEWRLRHTVGGTGLDD